MVKQAPTPGRLLVIVGFALSCFGLLLFLWLAFGGPVPLKPKGYRFQTSFGEATQLAVEADVRISGVPVGKVKSVRPDRASGRSVAVIEMQRRFAPIPRDARATLRQKTLLGETYVELTPGNRRAGMLPDGGVLGAARVADTVELDEIFRTFDPRTRRAFQTWMQGQAQALRGRGLDVNDTLGTLEPFAEDTTALLKVLNGQQPALQRTVRDTGVVFDALSRRRGELRRLIVNGSRVFSTTARRDRQLRELFTVLPTFNTEARATVDRLTRFARTTDPLVTQLRPAARELSPTLQQLRLVAPDLKALFADLGPAIRASERGLPATRRFLEELRPALAELDPTLRKVDPVLSFVAAYRRELTSFLAGPAAATQAVSTDGVHYLRTENPVNPENFAPFARRSGSNRTDPYRLPGAFAPVGSSRGAASYDTRHCANATPRTDDQGRLAQQLRDTLPQLSGGRTDAERETLRRQSEELARTILTFGVDPAGGSVPAPACRAQGPFRLTEGAFTGDGELSTYPHVREAASSTRRPR